MNKIIPFILLLFAGSACSGNPPAKTTDNTKQTVTVAAITHDTTLKVAHIYVALCDNKYQGIVPVPKAIGNGQDANNNLYWGCGFGIRTFFKKSKEWKLLKAYPIDDTILERLVFKSTTKNNTYLVADAYNGKEIKQCTRDFLNGSAGKLKDTVSADGKLLGIAGNAAFLSYIGHDGLMDFSLSESFANADGKTRDVVILACYSKRFFQPHLKQTKANPLVWTTNLMCPEAYTLHDALTGYLNNETNEQIRTRAAKAYAQYQKCSEKAARGLLVTDY